MKAYEFSTRIAPDGMLPMPHHIKSIPVGTSVKVIILTDEENENRPEENLFPLDELIKDIKRSPSDPTNIIPASGLLAEHLAEAPDIMSDVPFDVDKWNQEWDEIETEMKMKSIAEQRSEAELL